MNMYRLRLDRYVRDNDRRMLELKVSEKVKICGDDYVISEINALPLTDKTNALTYSLFGFFGADRYKAGQKIVGVVKGVVSVSLLMTFFVMTGLVIAKVLEFFSDFASGSSNLIYSFTDMLGIRFAYSYYTVAAVCAGYIVWLVIDSVLCYRRVIRNNADKINDCLDKME